MSGTGDASSKARSSNHPFTDVPVTTRQSVMILSLSSYFATMPTRVFIALASDLIILGAILAPAAIAFMVLILSIDTTFELPFSPTEIEDVSARNDKFVLQLRLLFQLGIVFIGAAIVAKSLSVWFVNRGWLAQIIDRSAAFVVGFLAAYLVIRIYDLSDIFGYLSVGKDIKLRVRASERSRASPP